MTISCIHATSHTDDQTMAVPPKMTMKLPMAWLPLSLLLLFLLAAPSTAVLSTSSWPSSIVTADDARTDEERKLQRREWPTRPIFHHLTSLRERNVTRPSVPLILRYDRDGANTTEAATTTAMVNMVEISEGEAAMTPSTLFSIDGRNRREIGSMGHSFLVLDRRRGRDDDGAEFSSSSVIISPSSSSSSSEVSFGFLLVDWNSFQLRGIFVIHGKAVHIDDRSDLSLNLNLNFNLNSNSNFNLNSNQQTLPKEASSSPSWPFYAYQINLRLVTDASLTLPTAIADATAGTPTCLAQTYLNSLVTAANSILEWEIRTHLHVVAVDERTDAVLEWDRDGHGHIDSNRDRDRDRDRANYDYYDYDQVETFLQNHNILHDDDELPPLETIHLRYALLGKPIQGNGDSGDGTGRGTICDGQPTFLVLDNVQSHWDGRDGDANHALDERWLQDLRRLLKLIGRSLGSGDAHSYEPPIDNCSTQCPKNSTFGSSQWATIMSSCDEHCTGGMQNIQLTLGGFYSGTGNITNVENWVNTPNLHNGNNGFAGEYNTDPKRVPFHIFTHLQTLDESDPHCGLAPRSEIPSNGESAAKQDIIINACPIPSQTSSIATSAMKLPNATDGFRNDITPVIGSSSSSSKTAVEDIETIRNPIIPSVPVSAPAPKVVRQNDVPTTTPVIGTEEPTNIATYKPTADSTYAPTTPLPTTSPTPYPTQVPSGPPPTEAPTGSSAPTLSYKPTSSGQGAETEPPTKKPTMNTTKKPTANPTTTKRTPSPTKSNNVGGGGPPPPVPLVSSRPRPLLNLNSSPNTIFINSPTTTTQSSSTKSDKYGGKSEKNDKSRKRTRQHGS